jgi:hypothetical protein
LTIVAMSMARLDVPELKKEEKFMTAGTSATTSGGSVLHRTDPALPYAARRLTRGERNSNEVFIFYSPKNRRIATISGAIHAALAIQLEFDPSITAYVERPRRIQYSPKQQIDISFWTRSKNGEERFQLLVPECGTMSSTSGIVSIRDRSRLDACAAANGVVLHYPTERDLMAARSWLATGFELLPWVWWYGRLLTRSLIKNRIRGHLSQVEKVSLSALISALDFPPPHVRAVVAAMVHEGSLQLVDYVPGAQDAILKGIPDA